MVGTGRRGCGFTLLIGMLGGVLGGILFNAAGQRGLTRFGAWSILVAFVGASLVLAALEAVSPSRRR
ncbi:MAG: GlsB/YeaQ/YmgE family stress response membrane protein [Actinomyces sp.]|nr:MAG: GlsB/YeaQ/YmgE family stress response membrane protein [Actinomyces sp.]